MAELINSYYSNGKILLTGEYFVLKGAKSVALPVKFGQSLEVFNSPSENQISWKAYDPDGLWFSCILKLPDFEILQTNDKVRSLQLIEIFKNIQRLKEVNAFNHSLAFETSLNFNPELGLGTSSTLVANLAKWAGVDPFQLNELSFKGSGFDVACATADAPISYRKGKAPVELDLNYPFREQLFFVYSGKKKATKNEVQRFLSNNSIIQSEIDQMDLLSEQFISAESLQEFQSLIRKHEQMVSEAIGIEPLKETLFKDFNGAIKSLGAWGGDFFLAATNWDKSKVRNYFREKGFEPIFMWDELVLSRNR